MGKIMDIIKKLGNKNLISRPDDGLPDDETRDRYLKSLRRQWRRIEDRKEKIYLRKKIAEDERRENSKILTEQGILKGKKKQLRKKQSFLGKGNL